MTQAPSTSLCNRAAVPACHVASAPSDSSLAHRNDTIKKVVLVGFVLITVTLAAVAINYQLLPLAIGAIAASLLTFLCGVLFLRGESSIRPNSAQRPAAPIRGRIALAALPALPPIQESDEPIDWENRLVAVRKRIDGCYNLRDPHLPISEPTRWGHCIRLPILGRYQSQDFAHRHRMAARLPASQLHHFPQEIQDQFRDKKNIELFFLVFDDVDANTRDDLTRNIAMHAVAIPDRNEGIINTMTLKMYHPRGVVEHPDTNHAIAVAGNPRVQRVHLHPTANGRIALSPNNARIRLERGDIDVASFFITAEGIRGRNVAFHALILKNPESEEGRKLEAAMQTDTVDAFLNHLNNNDFRYAEEVLGTFGRRRRAD